MQLRSERRQYSCISSALNSPQRPLRLKFHESNIEDPEARREPFGLSVFESASFGCEQPRLETIFSSLTSRGTFLVNSVAACHPNLNSMFQNYFKIAVRNLLHNKSFSIINIAGLSIGMTCCLIIFQYIALESSFDEFHQNKDNIYRVLQAFARGNDDLGTGRLTPRRH